MTESTTTLILHHLKNSRSQRILWLLEELGVPYTIKKHERTAIQLAPPELLEVHPLGKAPVISDGDTVIAESGVIVEYLLGKYGGGRFDPPEAGRLDNLYFTHYGEGSLQPILSRILIQNMTLQSAPPETLPVLDVVFPKLDELLNLPNLEKHGNFIEAHLKKSGDWLAGGDHPTAADFLMIFSIETFIARCPQHVGPKAREYAKRIQARPAYQRGLEKGGKYDYLLKEHK